MLNGLPPRNHCGSMPQGHHELFAWQNLREYGPYLLQGPGLACAGIACDHQASPLPHNLRQLPVVPQLLLHEYGPDVGFEADLLGTLHIRLLPGGELAQGLML